MTFSIKNLSAHFFCERANGGRTNAKVEPLFPGIQDSQGSLCSDRTGEPFLRCRKYLYFQGNTISRAIRLRLCFVRSVATKQSCAGDETIFPASRRIPETVRA
jgi:hypothetical protein